MADSLRAMDKKRRALTLSCWALMIASPFLLLLILSVALRHSVFQSYPVWTDELDYWRSLLNWQSVGFHTGYSGLFEAIPEAGTLSVHGLSPILLYGWFVKLFGLGYTTIMTCNAVWISLGALVFCALRRPRPAVALLFSGLLLCYVPIVLYCVTSMTELFNYALLLFYLAFLLRYHEKGSPWMLLLCCLTVAFGCLYRITYFLLFLPVLLVFSRFRPGWRMALGALAALLLSALCYLFSSRLTAPYIQGFLYHLVRAESPETFIQMLLSHTKSNLIDYFVKPTDSPMEDAFRWLYCGVTLLCLLGSFLRVSRAESGPRLRFRFSKELFACFVLLLTAFGVIAVLYETNDWSDFRTLSPFLWLVAGYLLARGRLAIPVATLGASVVTLALLAALPPVGAYADPYRFERAPYDETISQAAACVTYDPNATDPFDNTVRLDIPGLQIVEELAPGLGLQYGWFTTETTGKSRWIVTDHLKCVIENYESYENLLYLPGMKVFKFSRGGGGAP